MLEEVEAEAVGIDQVISREEVGEAGSRISVQCCAS